MDERAEQLNREFAVQETAQVPKEIGGIPPVAAAATKQETTPEEQASETVESSKEEIMIPKWRFDEINSKYQELRTQASPKVEQPAPTVQPFADIDKLVDQKLAPFRVQMEVDRVLKAHPDFQELAPQVMERIKNKPALTLEEAYQLEKFSQVESKAKEEGKQEALQTIEKKASLSPDKAGRKSPPKPVEELISDKSIPLSEIEKMLPHA